MMYTELKPSMLSSSQKKYRKYILQAFQSLAFAESIQKREEFSQAALLSLNELVLTSDGNFPTETPDSTTILISDIKTDSIANFEAKKN